MFRKIFSTIIIFGLFLLLLSDTIEAKLLPRFRSQAKRSSAVAGSVVFSPKLRSDRKAINLYFSNLSKANNVTYTLIYQANGKDEGVMGSIDSKSGNTASRELLFGTCSAGVCRYHTNIKNARLEVVTKLLSGKKLLKRFKIRV